MLEKVNSTHCGWKNAFHLPSIVTLYSKMKQVDLEDLLSDNAEHKRRD